VIEIVRYQRVDGNEPFTEWIRALRDSTARIRIYARLKQVQLGNLGDVKAVGEGISELRVHAGPGYRIYYGLHGRHLVVLLCGGDKGSQSKDIDKAREYWMDWKRRQK
jgi:putative addiction module killer protein